MENLGEIGEIAQPLCPRQHDSSASDGGDTVRSPSDETTTTTTLQNARSVPIQAGSADGVFPEKNNARNRRFRVAWSGGVVRTIHAWCESPHAIPVPKGRWNESHQPEETTLSRGVFDGG